MKCDFCQGNKAIITRYINFGAFGERKISIDLYTDEGEHDLSVDMINENDGTSLISAFETIHFCPMCGRKLEEPFSKFNRVDYENISECIEDIENMRADKTNTSSNDIATGLQMALHILKQKFVVDYKDELKI